MMPRRKQTRAQDRAQHIAAERRLNDTKVGVPSSLSIPESSEETTFVPAISPTHDRVVIAINPQKASWTAAAVDASSQLVAIHVPVSRVDMGDQCVSGLGEHKEAMRCLKRRLSDVA